MSRFAVLLLYNLLLPPVLLCLLPASLLKMRRRGGYGSKFWQRFGRFDEATRQRLAAGAGRAVWVHAVSVGEVNVARKLISELLQREPERPVVLSVTTSTGYAVAVKDAPANLTVIFSPVDLPWIVRRVMRIVQPERLVLVEAEVWPNLVRRAQKHGVPVVLANARLSPRSERRFRRVRTLVAPVFGMLDRVLVQDTADLPRWIALGVARERIQFTGSVKYDLAGQPKAARVAEFRALLCTLFGDPLPPLLMAASTHAGEERAVADAFLTVRRTHPQAALLIAPRHFERRAEVMAQLESLGLRSTLRSTLPSAAPRPDVLVIDSTGELRDWQALASMVIIGKSFLARGGQNPAEAIAAGVPVITGPHMENFGALMDLLRRADGLTQLASVSELPAAITAFLDNPAPAQATANRGLAALESHRGATARSVTEMMAVPPSRPG